ncbi:MAG TPA: agmatinase [Longimicrobiales bacterium]|nr:agmatinase [Longimicrobiales bacterium]
MAPGAGGRAARHLPAALEDLPWELPHRFLGLDDVAADFETAGVVVLPVPWEATTSWGGGTREGPRAILEASRYIELYDQELDRETADVGIHTLPALELTRAGPEPAMEELRRSYGRVLEACAGRFLVMLGGEHAVSAPAVHAHADRLDGRLTVLQLDAHADLRAAYEGTPHSHASAMARIADRADVVAVGVRALSTEEVDFARSRDGITLVWAEEMVDGDAWMERALEALGPTVYLTFDVDYLDPSLMPSTGTPEPGGGDWYGTLRFLRRVFEERNVVACDVVELAPTPGLRAPDFLVAKLVYKLVGYHDLTSHHPHSR